MEICQGPPTTVNTMLKKNGGIARLDMNTVYGTGMKAESLDAGADKSMQNQRI